MKKWKVILGIVFSLLVVQVTVSFAEPVTVQAATTKSGLKKEKGKYYYYQKGKKIKKAWKTIKVKSKGKTYSYRYYFSKTGAACAAKPNSDEKYNFVVKKIGSKYYGFNAKGRMIKGTYVNSFGKFYVFHAKTGVYNASKSKKLRAAAVTGKAAGTLRSLLGKPQKTKVYSGSCFGQVFGSDSGDDVELVYNFYSVYLYKDSVTGQEFVESVASR